LMRPNKEKLKAIPTSQRFQNVVPIKGWSSPSSSSIQPLSNVNMSNSKIQKLLKQQVQMLKKLQKKRHWRGHWGQCWIWGGGTWCNQWGSPQQYWFFCGWWGFGVSYFSESSGYLTYSGHWGIKINCFGP
jgi:hypothetical protein